LPIAAVLVAMSKTNGGLHPAGAAKANGLVPNIGSAPKVGTITGWNTLLTDRPIRPRCGAMAA
jgi:hypothetical protein